MPKASVANEADELAVVGRQDAAAPSAGLPEQVYRSGLLAAQRKGKSGALRLASKGGVFQGIAPVSNGVKKVGPRGRLRGPG
jgi:hypothetical protein